MFKQIKFARSGNRAYDIR